MMRSKINVAIEVQDLRFSYRSRRRSIQSAEVLKGVSFTVDRGEIFGFLGPNGCGKTTLFRILSTQLASGQGSVRVLDRALPQESAAVRSQMGVAFQSSSLDLKLTVSENLLHQGHLYGLRGKNLKSRMEQVLTQVQLADRAADFAESLSGGMCRRLEIAKSFLHEPELLILDEPSTGLDPGARKDLWQYLKLLQQETGVTVLLTTHLMEEASRCDRLALLDQGRIVTVGTPESMTAEIGDDIVMVRATDPPSLANQIESRFSVTATLMDRDIRIERPDGHRFVTQLVESFPGGILSISVAKPSLEDVFIRHTGHRMVDEPIS